MSEQIKVLLSFDIRPGYENAYQRFVLEELLPTAQELGLAPTDIWHTAYGKYPDRLIGFVVDELATVRTARESQAWRNVMKGLEKYARNIGVRVVPLRGGFQW
ncbi:MAG: hypothetical protein FJ011_19070 [Chloroflexi bacterium]|nr:hypothetical protein [Chloroflexota bacterium]